MAPTILLTGAANWDNVSLIEEKLAELKRCFADWRRPKIIVLDDPDSEFISALEQAIANSDWTLEKYQVKTVFESNAEWRTHLLLLKLDRVNLCLAFCREADYEDLRSLVRCVDAANFSRVPVKMITPDNRHSKSVVLPPMYSQDLRVDSVSGAFWTLRDRRTLTLRWILVRMFAHAFPAIACVVALSTFSQDFVDPFGLIVSLPLFGAGVTFIWDCKAYWPRSPLENYWEIPPDLWGLKSEQICILFQTQPRIFAYRPI